MALIILFFFNVFMFVIRSQELPVEVSYYTYICSYYAIMYILIILIKDSLTTIENYEEIGKFHI